MPEISKNYHSDNATKVISKRGIPWKDLLRGSMKMQGMTVELLAYKSSQTVESATDDGTIICVTVMYGARLKISFNPA